MISTRTVVQSLSLFDFDVELLIFVIFFGAVNKFFDVFQRLVVDEYAAFGVVGACAQMDADAFSVGYVANLGHEFFELRRPCQSQRIRAGRDEVVAVLEGVIRQGFVRVEGDG